MRLNSSLSRSCFAFFPNLELVIHYAKHVYFVIRMPRSAYIYFTIVSAFSVHKSMIQSTKEMS